MKTWWEGCSTVPATSSLALRATAKGGFGLDLAASAEPRATMASTAETADFDSVEGRKERACMMNRD
jgi:hypothetical protein